MFKPVLFSLLKNNPNEFVIKNIFADIGAGAVVAFIAVPLSIALSMASGVSPGKGLVTAVVAGFLISFFGGSRVQIGGPTGAFVIIVYEIIQTYGLNGLIIATGLAGVLLVIMGLLKFGKVIKYIPDPIIIGFTNGIGIVLFSTQINDFFGLEISKIPTGFIAKWLVYLKSIPSMNWSAFAIGAGSLLLMLFYPKKFKILPAPLCALIVSTLVVQIFNIPVDTIFSHFGDMQNTVKLIPEIPYLNFELLKQLLPPALTIAILAGIESLLSAVVADGMVGAKHNSNTELIAQGFANIGSSFFGGIPATGAIARTAANIQNGGRTPLAGIFHAIFIFIIMSLFMKYISLIPMASLAAILFTISYKMVNFRAFLEILKAPVSDSIVLIITLLLTVFVNLVYAIEIGMLFAAFLFMKRMSDISGIDESSDVYEGVEEFDLKDKTKLKDVVIYEINGPFFFGAAGTFIEYMEKLRDCKAIILRMRKVPAMDETGYHALYKIYKKCLASGTRLILCQIQRQPLKVLRNYGFISILGRSNFALNVDSALKKAEEYVKELNLYNETFHIDDKKTNK
ncbi:MAG: STAS domain-containing protein [Elusimicrobiota bacterium]|nr:STAS domain-containing protein [Elusimicrobiota bacterium]